MSLVSKMCVTKEAYTSKDDAQRVVNMIKLNIDYTSNLPKPYKCPFSIGKSHWHIGGRRY